MAPHHNHDPGHHHNGHEASGNLSFNQKLIIRLEHWVRHNDDHAKTYEEWSQQAKENDLEAAGLLLADIAVMTRLISGKFEEALAVAKKHDSSL